MTPFAALVAAVRAFRPTRSAAWRLVAACAGVLLAADAVSAVADVLLRGTLPREVASLAIGWGFTVPLVLGVVYGSLPCVASERLPGIADCWRLGAARYGTAWRAILSAIVLLCGALAVLGVVGLPAYAVRPLGWVLLVPCAAAGLFAILCLWAVVPLVFLGGAGFGITAALHLCGSRWAPMLGLALGCAVPGIPLAWLSSIAAPVPILGPVVDAFVAAGLQVFVALVVSEYVQGWLAEPLGGSGKPVVA